MICWIIILSLGVLALCEEKKYRESKIEILRLFALEKPFRIQTQHEWREAWIKILELENPSSKALRQLKSGYYAKEPCCDQAPPPRFDGYPENCGLCTRKFEEFI